MDRKIGPLVYLLTEKTPTGIKKYVLFLKTGEIKNTRLL